MQALLNSWSAPNKRITEFDGLRALAVILVFLNHFAPVRSVPWLNCVRQVGWVGVDIFFVLSGFLITGILLENRSEKIGYYKNFYMRRSLRTFPLYYGLLTVVLLVMSISKGGKELTKMMVEWGNPVWLYVYFGNVKTAILNVSPPSYFIPLWSLHVEEQFYLIFPFLVRRLNIRQLQNVLIGGILVAPLIRFGLFALFPERPLLQYMLLPCRMDALAFGALIVTSSANALLRPRLKVGMFLVTFGILCLAYQTFWWAGGTFDTPIERTAGYSLFDLSFAGCLILVLNFRGCRGTAWLNWKPLQFIGMISYGIYLFQLPSAALVNKVLRTTNFGGIESDTTSYALCVAATCIGLATISWYLWEIKWLRLKSRFVGVSVDPTRIK